MTGLALADIVGVLGFAGTGAAIDDVAVDVFVVDGEDAPGAVGKQGHAVVVVAEGAFLAGARAARRPGRTGSSPTTWDRPTWRQHASRSPRGTVTVSTDVGGNRHRSPCVRVAARTGERSAIPPAPATNAAAPNANAAAEERRGARSQSRRARSKSAGPGARIVPVIELVESGRVLIGYRDHCLAHMPSPNCTATSVGLASPGLLGTIESGMNPGAARFHGNARFGYALPMFGWSKHGCRLMRAFVGFLTVRRRTMRMRRHGQSEEIRLRRGRSARPESTSPAGRHPRRRVLPCPPRGRCARSSARRHGWRRGSSVARSRS